MSTNNVSLNLYKEDPVSVFPKDLMITNIFGFLKRGDLFKAMLVCKTWSRYAQDFRLWKKEISLLNLKDFSELSIKVRKYQRIIKQIENLFEKSKVTKERLPQLKTGFQYALCLYELGLKPLEELVKYANDLKDKLFDLSGWKSIALKLIEINMHDDALQVMRQFFTEQPDKELIEKFVHQLCRDKKLQQAIELVKEFSINQAFPSFKSEQMLLTAAKGIKDGNLIENVIDQIVSEKWKNIEIQSFIASCLQDKQAERAIKAASKYENYLDKATGSEVHSSIKIYVSLNQKDKAWNLAKKHMQEDNFVLSVLRDAFRECNFLKEAQEAQEIFDKITKPS